MNRKSVSIPPSAHETRNPSVLPLAQIVNKINQNGDLLLTRLAIDLKNFSLNVEEFDFSVPLSPISSDFSKPQSPASTSGWLRFSFVRPHRSNYCGSPSITTYQIAVSEIHDIRLSDYNKKLVNIRSDSLQELILLTNEGRKNSNYHFKIIEVCHGTEFNLKQSQFIVLKLIDPDRGSREDRWSVLDEWIRELEKLIKSWKSLECFQRLNLWYQSQFSLTTATNIGSYRLQIWKQFLHRNHHNIKSELLQQSYDYLEQRLRPYLQNKNFMGPISKAEFYVIARYFVHSSQVVSTIFNSFSPRNDSHLLQLLEIASEDELNNHPVLIIFLKLFTEYFSYIKRHGQELHAVCAEADQAPMSSMLVIRKFAEIVHSYAGNILIQEKWLHSNYLLDYLFSIENTIWSRDTTKLHQDMTKPLSNYWISSSHNTYLTGDQYKSESSVESYARVLRQGCRCVQIDVWNGPSNKPIVKHGRTLTSAITLKKVLMTIKAHAFVTSPYPVIISIENHCNLRQQRNMAKCFLKIFGKMLVTSSITDGSSSDQKMWELPSPEQLKYKIILKGKKLPLSSEKLTNQTSNDSTEQNHKTDPSQEKSSCDSLVSGDLWKCAENGKWVQCIFVLSHKSLFYIENIEDKNSNGQEKVLSGIRKASCNSNSSQQADLHNDQLWFHGDLCNEGFRNGRDVATSLLRQYAVNGMFLVRHSSTQNGFTLSMYYRDPDIPPQYLCPGVHHFTIYQAKNLDNQFIYSLSENHDNAATFPNIYALVNYFHQFPVITEKCRFGLLKCTVPASTTHEDQEWFYKYLDRKAAENILAKLQISGAFLGRYREDGEKEIVISFQYHDVIKHCHIKRQGIYFTVSNSKFEKLEHLVENYSKIPFYKNLTLNHPVDRVLHNLSQLSIATSKVYACSEYLYSTVNTLRGRYLAIQSHRTSDPGMLSFRKGDIIVNVAKDASGWWSGTREDAIGMDAEIAKEFPESFVEEIQEIEKDCPFEFEGHLQKGVWDIGNSSKLKVCKDKAGKEFGIKYYISFKYGGKGTSKQYLGASCSKRKAMEWVEMINWTRENDSSRIKSDVTLEASEKYNIASEFSDLIVYCGTASTTFSEDDTWWERNDVNVCQTTSLDELSANRIFKLNPKFFVWYHQFALTRIYPKAYRLDSSNYNPTRFWNVGSQMVALNFQTPDKSMQWNRGKFKQNGNSGYVLKPDFMRTGKKSMGQFDPTKMSEDFYRKEINLSVQIIAARHLVKQRSGQISPIVEIEVVGVDVDRAKYKTSCQHTGLNPHWNETFHLKIYCPELALIQFSVYDVDTFSDRLFLGEATIPFACMRPGYRSVQLYNSYGFDLISSLLIYSQIK